MANLAMPKRGVPVPSEQAHYRQDIQGLRAMAVLMVIAFHAQLSVPGGFLGVDVFFVISGFVITTVLQRQLSAASRMNFGQFYLRRFKRLAPALALTVTLTMLISAFVLSPFGAQQNAAKTGISAMLMVANGYIASTDGGYFDTTAETNPLLNTWSLSVEEQYYLIFPVLIVFGLYLARSRFKLRSAPLILVSTLAISSFALAAVDIFDDSDGTASRLLGFYSPITRAWEFAVGAILALTLGDRRLHLPFWLMNILGAVGLTFLAASLSLITETTPFRSLWTVLPVLGTLLLLFSGSGATTFTSRLLSTAPMVKVGNWSYSLYLWHWPVIVFAMYLFPMNPYASIVGAVIALVPAILSYKFVEQPLRWLTILSRRQLALLLCLVLVPPIFISGVVGLSASRYWIPKYQAGEVSELIDLEGATGPHEFFEYLEDVYFPCANSAIRTNSLAWDGFVRCRQSQPSADVEVVLVGDSHAEHLFPGFADALPQTNIAYYILDSSPVSDGGGMDRIIQEVASDPTVTTVIVNSHWGDRGVPTAELRDTLLTFSEAGKAVFVTDDIPSFPFSALECKFGASPWNPVPRCTIDYDTFRDTYSVYIDDLTSAVNAIPGAELLVTSKYFCQEDSCDMTKNGQIFYRGFHHLNSTGSHFLASKLLEDNPSLDQALSLK